MSKLAVEESSPVDAESQESLTRHGLSLDPFNDSTLTSDTFFMGGDRRAVLDEVLHLCQFSNNLVAVLGEAGVGKTAFVQQTMVELEDTALCCLVQASVMTDVEAVVRQIADQLGVFLPDDASVEQMLSVLGQYTPTGLQQRVVIIVDDSHHLNDLVLAAFIFLLQKQSAYYLHILLVGDSSLLLRLDQMEKGELLVYDIPLCPFTVDELEQYLAFKLAVVGYQGVELFDYDSVHDIWKNTRGIPASVNHVARNILLNHSLSDDNEKSLGLPIWHMAAVVALLAALIMAVFYVGDDGVSTATEDIADVPANSTTEQITPAAALKEETAKETAVIEPIDQPTQEPELVEEPITPTTDTTATETIAPTAETEENKPTEPEPVLSEKETAPTVKQNDTEAPKPEKKPIKIQEEVVKVDAQSVLTTPPQPEPKVTSSTASSSFTRDEDAVLFWDSESYTLQLLAARQLPSVQQYVDRQSNNNLLRIVSFERDGDQWYAVLVGVYPTLEEAREGVKSLPASQIQTKPWPRKIDGIQQKIREFRRK